MDFDKWMEQMKQLQTPTPEPTKKRIAYSRKELQASDLAVAYVTRNSDGSFTQFKIHKTSIRAVWTTVVAETQSNKNAVTDLRLAPLDEWENPDRRKRNVFAHGVPIQPNECLKKCLQNQPIENPVLLVCWEKPPQAAVVPQYKKACTQSSKEWHYFLFTNSTDTSETNGGPVVLVHSATGTHQLDECGIKSVASSAFINWVTNKVRSDSWQVISMTNMSTSVRVRMGVVEANF